MMYFSVDQSKFAIVCRHIFINHDACIILMTIWIDCISIIDITCYPMLPYIIYFISNLIHSQKIFLCFEAQQYRRILINPNNHHHTEKLFFYTLIQIISFLFVALKQTVTAFVHYQ